MPQKQTAMIRLNHTCNIPEAMGMPGDEIEVPADVAKKLIERRGAIEVESADEPTKNEPPKPTAGKGSTKK